MPLYNVTVTLTTTMVVVAENDEDARYVARDHAERAFDDADETPQCNVTGEVTHERHLRDGWDVDCLPYGGDGNTRLRSLLTPNA